MVQPSAAALMETPQTLPTAQTPGQAWRPDEMGVPGIQYHAPTDELYRELRQKVEEGRDRSASFRKEAKESFDLAAGWQWNDDDLAVLRDGDRPEITFNRVGRNLDLLSGQEIQSRDELTFLPREDGDVIKSEILSSTVQYINDETDSPDEVSDAFRDLCTCGMGWTETHMNYRNFKMGLPQQVRRDPLSMFWDPYATRRNLKDAEWVARVVSMPMKNAMRRFPNINPAMLNAFWMGFHEDPTQPQEPERQTYSYDTTSQVGRPPLLSRVTMIEVQWYEVEAVVEMEDLYTGERMTMTKRRAEAIMHNIPNRFRGLPRDTNVYYTAVLGGQLLARRKMEDAGDFTYQCMTGKRDGRQSWFGIVRAMRDPQKWANKWLSQSMNVMNRNSKGGVVAEVGAFLDPVKAEQDWGKTGSFTWAEPGTIAEGRYKEKDPPSFPEELHHLMPVALQSIQECAGIPPESIGTTNSTSDANKSALFEHERREAGLVIMTYLFDAKRLHTKRQGRITLRFILKFMNDGRLVRIVERGQQKYVPLIFESSDPLRYDVIVSDAPDSPNQRAKTWAFIERMMPFIMATAPSPQFLASMVRASPLSSKHQQEFVKHLDEEAAKAKEEPPLDGKEAAAIAKVPAEIQKLYAEAKQKLASSKELESQAMVNLAQIKNMGTKTTLEALEGIRETIAVDDAARANKLTVQEHA